MTKEELIDLVKIRLEDKYQIKVIEAAISRAWNQIIYNTFRSNPDDLDLYAKEYLIESDDISTDSNTGLYYFTLPATISQLPRNEQLRSIRPKQDTSGEFDIITISQRATLNNLSVMDIAENRTSCIVRGSRIEFQDLSSANKTGGVIADIIVSFDEYSDTDDIYVPSGQDNSLLELTVNFLIGIPNEVKKDNNTNKQT